MVLSGCVDSAVCDMPIDINITLSWNDLGGAIETFPDAARVRSPKGEGRR